MNRSTTSAAAPGGCGPRLLPVCLLALLCLPVQALSDDDFLRAVEEEAARVEAVTEGPAESGTSAQEAPATAEERGSRAEFEERLKKYRGTYSFYQTLLEKDKAEVYKAYREGASFARIRRMIVNRKLHR